MKTFTYTIMLLAFVGLSLFGCADKSSSPVAPTDNSAQAPDSPKKYRNVDFTISTYPIWVTPEPNMWLAGRELHMKDVAVWDTVFSSDPRIAGRMEHHLTLTLDVITGEGPCHGSFTTITDPNVTGGGVWVGTYEGYRSKTSDPFVFLLPLRLEGHGRGGTIDGMQMFCKADLTVYTDATNYPVPTFWTSKGEGFIKEH
jgi:hypothetical protein